MAIDINIPSQVKNYANLAGFPATGSLKTIFIAEDTNKTYRWTGSAYVEISASASSSWGTITGTLSTQTDLQTALNAKQATLVSGTNIKTINSTSLLGSGDIAISSGLTVGTTAITSGTIGGILFQNGSNLLGQDSALFWDNTNKRLGVGATPSTSVRLDVRAQGALSTDLAFRVRNSADTTNIFQINGDGSGGFNIDAKNIKFGTGSYITTGANSTNSLIVGFALFNCALSNNLNGSNQTAYGFNHLNIGGSLSTDGTKTLEIAVGTAPTSTGANSIKMYAAQIGAYGTAAPHFRTADGNIIKLYRQPTGGAASTFVVGVGTAVTDASTFDGYTIGQIVKALRNTGILA